MQQQARQAQEEFTQGMAAPPRRMAAVKKRVVRLGRRIGNMPEKKSSTLTGLGLLSVAGSLIVKGAPAIALGAFAATVLGGGALAAGVARAEKRAKLRAAQEQKKQAQDR